MRINGLKSVFAWVIACTFAFSALADGQWKKVKDNDGIQVFVRPVEGSPLNEFKGEAILDYNYQVISTAIGDVPALSTWMPECKTSKMIEILSANQVILYQEMNVPWPVSNRDYVIESTMTQTPDKIIRSIRAVKHDKVPIKDGVVRITDMDGEWMITKVKDKKTHVSYRIRSNPGGSLPTWLANSAAKDIPFNTIKGLRQHAGKDKYKDN